MTDKAYRMIQAEAGLRKAIEEIERFQGTMAAYEDGHYTDAGLRDQAEGRLKGIALQALKEAIEDINAATDGED